MSPGGGISRPIFSVGTARGGTNLLAKMLSVHPEMYMAADPYLPLFRSLRNGILRQADPEIRNAVNPEGPLDDYYFSRTKWRALGTIQNATLDVPFASSDRPALLEAMTTRAKLSAGNVVPLLDQLNGSSYKELFQSALKILEEAAQTQGRRWVGLNENWAVEFFPALARSFPDAKFMVLLRDPRGPVASALLEKEKAKVPHVLSFARHWRKAAALMLKYQKDSLFEGRLLTLTYEHLVREPEQSARQLCDFLGVKFLPEMLDTDRYLGADGKKWTGNSHQKTQTKGIYASSVRAWQKDLSPEAVELVEFICDPDMRLLGHEPVRLMPDGRLTPKALEFAEADSRNCLGWRSDSGETEREVGCEYFRRQLLEQGDPLDPWWVRTSFLDDAVLERLTSDRRILTG